VTAPAGGTTISVANGNLPASGTCNISVDVVATATGVLTNTTGNVTSTNGGTGGTASATLTVIAPPSIAKSFAASVIIVGGDTTLTFTITNPNTTTALTGVAVSDTLPAGLVVAATPNVANTCTGLVIATAGAGTISLTGGSI